MSDSTREEKPSGEGEDAPKKEAIKPEVVHVASYMHDDHEEKVEQYHPQPSEMLRKSSDTITEVSDKGASSDDTSQGPHDLKHVVPSKIVGQDFHTIISPTGPPMVTSVDIVQPEPRQTGHRESVTSVDASFPLPEPKPLPRPSIAATIARASVEARLRDKGYQLGKLLGEGSYAKV